MTTSIDPHTLALWLLLGIVALALGLHCWADPRRQERAMARKQERRTVADILSEALQDAAHQGRISKDAWHKYNKKVAQTFQLPDMEPRFKIPEWLVKMRITRRLEGMGVNVQKGLEVIRLRRPDKKKRLMAKLKK